MGFHLNLVLKNTLPNNKNQNHKLHYVIVKDTIPNSPSTSKNKTQNPFSQKKTSFHRVHRNNELPSLIPNAHILSPRPSPPISTAQDATEFASLRQVFNTENHIFYG